MNLTLKCKKKRIRICVYNKDVYALFVWIHPEAAKNHECIKNKTLIRILRSFVSAAWTVWFECPVLMKFTYYRLLDTDTLIQANASKTKRDAVVFDQDGAIGQLRCRTGDYRNCFGFCLIFFCVEKSDLHIAGWHFSGDHLLQ